MSFKPILDEDIVNYPEFVQRVWHWVRLLDFKVAVLKDLSDDSVIFIFVVDNSPDLIFGINATGHLATIYSNILTELTDEITVDKSNSFLKKALKLQISYPRLRINILEAENDPVRILSNYKMKNLNMEFFAELILEGMDFLAKVNEIIVKLGLPETWRKAEGEEEKIEEKKQFNIFQYS